MLGEEAELRCWLSPNISAHLMELRWFREQPSPAVHVRRAGQDKPEEQMPEYHNRTTFVDLDMARGEAALRIHRVTASDNGSYHCLFKEDRVQEGTTLWLQVAGVGSKPRIQVIHTPDRAVWAECTSEGWYPEPKIEWRGQRGCAKTNFSVSATTGLWAVVSRVALQDAAVEGLSCSISNPVLPERKVAKSHLPAPFSRGSQFMKWRLALPLSLLAMGLLMAGVICLFGKCQREVNRTQLMEEIERGGEEQIQQASMARPMPLHVSPSLDPDTASPKLIVSEDQKSVRRLLFDQDLPSSSRRFERDPCILAQERFWAGRYYWEVEVGDRKAWILGVCLESVGREGRVPKAPQHGLWAVELYKNKFRALSYPRTPLSPSQPLHKVGIFLDWDAGEISFHNVADSSLVYTFHGLTFSGPLQPFLCLWTHDPRPLTICSVVRKTQEAIRTIPQASDFPHGTPRSLLGGEQHLHSPCSCLW
ncbi:PREDICTED: butyrophilin-like protein 10 [Chinchilla lanigera]|uniref:butyrophilin-like protein 10 n=1 Tax=Chinchilla lanigera TaxID=34839 RepID=UPI00038EBA53|nr:PREDICTED: butyrophilin-like protein 10 [Chinchilla lanigera]